MVPLLKSAGCYVDKEDETAFMFQVDGKLTYVTGVQAFTQAMVSPHQFQANQGLLLCYLGYSQPSDCSQRMER